MRRACLCGNARPGPWTREQCSICWHQLYGPHSGHEQPPARPAQSPATCRRGGTELGGTRVCRTCGGNVRLKLFACERHGEVAARDCGTCPDFEARP